MSRFIVWVVVNKFRDLVEMIIALFDVTGICVGGAKWQLICFVISQWIMTR